MIKDVYTTIEEIEDNDYYLYRLYSNGSSFKRIEKKDIFLNQKEENVRDSWPLNHQ
jgi:hypothetical protein